MFSESLDDLTPPVFTDPSATPEKKRLMTEEDEEEDSQEQVEDDVDDEEIEQYQEEDDDTEKPMLRKPHAYKPSQSLSPIFDKFQEVHSSSPAEQGNMSSQQALNLTMC